MFLMADDYEEERPWFTQIVTRPFGVNGGGTTVFKQDCPTDYVISEVVDEILESFEPGNISELKISRKKNK